MGKFLRSNWVNILVLLSLSLSLLEKLINYIEERSVLSLVFMFVHIILLIVYICFLIFLKIYTYNSNFYFVYDNSFVVEGVDVITDNSKIFIKKKNCTKYSKYGINSEYKCKYKFENSNFKMIFSIMNFDSNRKIILIHKLISKTKKDISMTELSKVNYENYLKNHKIEPLNIEGIVCEKNNSVFVVVKNENLFELIEYNYCVPFYIYSLKKISDFKCGWEIVDEEEFDSYDDAVDGLV